MMKCHRISIALLLGFAALALQAQPASPDYDLLLKNGHVIDPKNNIDEVYDVAIKDGKIAKVAKDIPADFAVKTIVLHDMYVVPGLIDMHVHVYAGTGERN